MTLVTPFQSLPGYRDLVSKPFPALKYFNNSLWGDSELTKYANGNYYLSSNNNKINFFTYLDSSSKEARGYKAARAFVGFAGEIAAPVSSGGGEEIFNGILEVIKSSLPLWLPFSQGSKKLNEHALNWFVTLRDEFIKSSKSNPSQDLQEELDEKYMDEVMYAFTNFRLNSSKLFQQYGLKNPQGLVTIATVNEEGTKSLLSEAVKYQHETTTDPMLNLLLSKIDYHSSLVRQEPEIESNYSKITVAPQHSFKELNEHEVTHHYDGGVKFVPNGSSGYEIRKPEQIQDFEKNLEYTYDINSLFVKQNEIFNQIAYGSSLRL